MGREVQITRLPTRKGHGAALEKAKRNGRVYDARPGQCAVGSTTDASCRAQYCPGAWPHPADVQYFDQFPVRQPSLLFAGLAYSEPRYLALWGKLNPDSEVEEVIRNYPIRQPVLWVA